MSGDPASGGGDPDRTCVVVELVRGSDPIRGSVRDEVADEGFSGWMELIDALERARLAAARPAARDAGAGETGG